MGDRSVPVPSRRRDGDDERSTADRASTRLDSPVSARVAAVGVVGLLMALTGCAALPGGGGVDADYPPGASQGGFDDPSLVAEGTRETLENRSFTLSWAASTGNVTSRIALQYGPAAAHLLLWEDGRSVWVEYVEVVDGEARLSRRSSDGTHNAYSYSAVEPVDEPLAGSAETADFTGAVVDRYQAEVASALRVGNYRAVETVEHDGETLIRYEATGGDRTRIEQRYDGSEFESVDFEGTVLVSERGVVHRVETRTEVTTAADGPVTRTRTIEVNRVGETTVRTPAWTNRTPSVRGSLERDGRVLALDHAGGESFVGRLELLGLGTAGDPFDEVTADVDDRFAAGDTLYLYAVESDGGVDLRVARAPPESLANAVDLRQFDSVRVAGLGTTRFSLSLSFEAD